MINQENPLKASRPIPAAAVPSPDEQLAFSINIFVDEKGMTMRTDWDVHDARAQMLFFEHHQLAAAMLVGIARGKVNPPMPGGCPSLNDHSGPPDE